MVMYVVLCHATAGFEHAPHQHKPDRIAQRRHMHRRTAEDLERPCRSGPAAGWSDSLPGKHGTSLQGQNHTSSCAMGDVKTSLDLLPRHPVHGKSKGMSSSTDTVSMLSTYAVRLTQMGQEGCSQVAKRAQATADNRMLHTAG